MSVELVVPWKPDAHRQRIWDFLRPRYGWPVVEALGGTPWCKGAAINPVVAGSSADVIVLLDADVWTDGLADAIRAVENGRPWAVPHTTVRRLAEQATETVLAGGPMAGQPLCRRPYPGCVGGGAVVARKDVLLDVPLDGRFVGWGWEDVSLGFALTTLHGRPWRGEHDLFHLWHPPQERSHSKWGSLEAKKLAERYRGARFKSQTMRKIVEEAKQLAGTAHQQRLHAA